MYAHAKKSAAGVQYYGSVFHYRVVVAAYNAQGKFLYGRMNTIAIIIQKTTIIHVKITVQYRQEINFLKNYKAVQTVAQQFLQVQLQ